MRASQMYVSRISYVVNNARPQSYIWFPLRLPILPRNWTKATRNCCLGFPNNIFLVLGFFLQVPHMETWKTRDHFHWGLDSPHGVDPCLDPTNSFSYCDPMAANTYHATFSQEPNIYPHDAPEPNIWKDEWNHEFVADKNGDCGFPVNEMKTIEAMVCKIPAPPCFPSPEEELSADVSGSEKSLKAGEIGDGSKRRKTRKSEKGPLCVFKTRSESNTVEDGYKWRKYGTKILKSNPHPRSYYRCRESSCSVKKRVEREATDPGLLVTTYEGIHNHESPSVIYYIGKPINLPQPPGSKPVIILVNPGVGSEAVMKFASQIVTGADP